MEKENRENIQQNNLKNFYADKTVKIKGYEFDLYINDQKGDAIFQDFVWRTLRELFENHLIPSTEIQKLQDHDYSKKTFGLNYALLVKEYRNCFDNTGKSRYWMRVERKIAGFYVCSQWWKGNVSIYEDKLKEWLQYLARIYNFPAK